MKISSKSVLTICTLFVFYSINSADKSDYVQTRDKLKPFIEKLVPIINEISQENICSGISPKISETYQKLIQEANDNIKKVQIQMAMKPEWKSFVEIHAGLKRIFEILTLLKKKVKMPNPKTKTNEGPCPGYTTDISKVFKVKIDLGFNILDKDIKSILESTQGVSI